MLYTIRVTILSLFVVAALFLSACQPIVAPVPTPTVAPTPTATSAPTSLPVTNLPMDLTAFKLTSQALAGNLLDDPAVRTIYILSPDYQTSGKRYPVLYVLPWGQGNAAAHVQAFKTAMEALLKTNEAKEMIIVFADGTNKLGASQFRSSPTIGDYETYVVQELVDYVDANYRTLPTRDESRSRRLFEWGVCHHAAGAQIS